MASSQVLYKCQRTLKKNFTDLEKLLDDESRESFYGMPERKIVEQICWVAFLSGYQYQSARNSWPAIRSSFFSFRKFLVNVFGIEFCVRRALKKCDNQAKLSILGENLNRAFALSEKHGGLRNWIDAADNIFKELTTTFRYIGPTNVKSLLDHLGFKEVSQNQKALIRFLSRLDLLSGRKPDTEAVMVAVKKISGNSGYNLVKTYTLLKLFANHVCTENPLCSGCEAVCSSRRAEQ
ncbi:MAG: hypothetical protein VR68_07535 [Peptococcaceae bacterium BRH_c4a]|nr:MAG: hypothetical protein VR68_07535 [Peptococcaceae bacterium BRH_c4a]